MASDRDTFESIIYVNKEQADEAVVDLQKKLDKLNQEYERLQKSEDKDVRQMAKIKQKIDATEKSIKNITVGTENYRKAMENLSGKSIENLIKLKKQLNAEIRKLKPGTEEYIKYTEDYKKVEARLHSLENGYKSVNKEIEKQPMSFKKVTDAFNKYWSIFDVAVRSLTGLSATFRKCAEEVAKLDDVYSDVMKTTGLSREEVVKLNAEFNKMDTRTSREQLNLLARDAGKLGISGTENILGFVRAADQIQVALGEDLGEGAIRNLGKIADVLGYTKSMGIEQALLSIGSAVNAVGQASTASEAYLVDFTQRLAGVAAQAGISGANIIGFASGLDQSAMKVEMAATAFQKFLMKLYEDPAMFAQYANMEVEKFSKLLKEDANEAVITILRNLRDQDGFQSLVPIFKDMGLDGARAVSVLAAMASNLTAITDAQSLANVEFEKATSLSEEFNTKNNNLQASLEKARKEFTNARIELGEKLNPILLKSTKATTYLIKMLVNHGKELRNAAIAVAALTLAVKLDNIVQAASNGLRKVSNALTNTGTFVVNKLKAAYFNLTNQTLKYTQAQNAANAAASKSVYGVLAIMIGTVTYKLTELLNKEKEIVDYSQKRQTLEEKITESYAEQKGQIDALTNIVNNNNLSLDKRRDALARLKEIVPNYHADLTEEGRLINNNTTALDAYLIRLKQSIRMKAYEDEYTNNEKNLMEYERRLEAAKKRRDEMIENNGGVEPNAYYLEQGSAFDAMTGNGYEYYPLIGWAKKVKTQYGEVLDDIEIFSSSVDTFTDKQKNLQDRIGLTMESEMKEMDKEISAVRDSYNKLIQDVWKSTDNQSEAKAEIRELEKERDAAIEAIRNKYAAAAKTESDENSKLTREQFDFLQNRYDQLSKKEKTMVDAGYESLSEEDSVALKKRYDRLMAIDKRLDDKRYQEQLKRIEQEQRDEENLAMNDYLKGNLTFQAFEDKKLEIRNKYIQKRIDLAKTEGKDSSSFEQQQMNAQLEARKKAYDEELELSKKSQKNEETELKKQLTKGEITQDQYDTKMIEIKVNYLKQRLELAAKYGQDETQIQQAYLDAQVEAEILALEQIEKMKKDAKGVKDSLRKPNEVRSDEMKSELEKLKTLHDAKLLSEQEYEKAVQNVHKKYSEEQLKDDLGRWEGYFEKANSLMEGASNFASALQSAETADLEAEYQARLTAAGDNAEEREKIEAEYEQKKLDLQKKYADADMVINIAKATASGALGIVKALEAGYPMGPILAAMTAATTAAEIATIIAQRNAIKSSSVNRGSSSGASSPTVVTPTGYSEGGFTGAGGKYEPAGIVHRGEWVAPAWQVRQNPVVFANLERYRRSHSHASGSASAGFANGGLVGADVEASDAVSQMMLKAIERLEANTAANTMALNRLMEEGVQAFEVYDQRQSFETQRRRFKNATTR